MSSNELVEQIMAQVIARVATPEQQAIPGQPQPIRETAMAEKSCSLTEFVGTAIGDTLGRAGHGSLIILGGNDVSDVKRGIEVALKELDRTFGDVYGNEAGHIELQYTARASYALEKAFGAPIGRACRRLRRGPSGGDLRPRNRQNRPCDPRF